ncbi:MAG TPA: VOC family protein [Candidatus Nitrosotalea sp.]|nr:VOC family protein [Candidatus Nitrosotalea sp.]
MRDVGTFPPRQFLGFDHLDVRVSSLALVEAFYDRLMPRLGLARKRTAFVDEDGEWFDAGSESGYNAVEYYSAQRPDSASFFIGFIERLDQVPSLTRIAFRVEDVAAWQKTLEEIGARNVEPSGEMTAYPAIFFEDPAGTRLELVARVPG